MRKAKLTIIIADSAEIFRRGLQEVLEKQSDLRVLDIASDGEEALRKTLHLKPNILLLDEDITRFHSYEILHRLNQAMSATRVLLISDAQHSDRRNALRMGVYGYLTRRVGAEKLLAVIRQIAQGEWIEAGTEDDILRDIPKETPLSVRELEVLKCITEGKSNQEIAETLYISEKTVKNHLTRIFRKMHVTDRTQAAMKAIREKQIVL